MCRSGRPYNFDHFRATRHDNYKRRSRGDTARQQCWHADDTECSTQKSTGKIPLDKAVVAWWLVLLLAVGEECEASK